MTSCARSIDGNVAVEGIWQNPLLNIVINSVTNSQELFTLDEYDAYESAAKEDAANGLNKVWECYVAGLNPTNATDVFRAVISIGADGAPVVGWEPDLNEGGTKHERVYTVEGRESLTDGSWGPTNAASRFFRVKVSMP